jgi:hypothetical protein
LFAAAGPFRIGPVTAVSTLDQKKDGTDQKVNGTAAGKESVNDGSGGQRSQQWTMEQGRTQQPTINGSGKGKQWLAKMRVRGQWLAIAVKRGSGWRRDYHGQREVIAVSGVAEASWIWTTKMHATEGGGKQEDGSILWRQRQLLR